MGRPRHSGSRVSPTMAWRRHRRERCAASAETGLGDPEFTLNGWRCSRRCANGYRDRAVSTDGEAAGF